MLSNKTAHLTAPPAPRSTPSRWRQVASDLTDLVSLLSGRPSIRVHVGPGLAGGSPGYYDIEAKTIVLDSDRCFPGLAPATIDLTDMRDHSRYLVGLGVLCHEAAHAAHTRWRPGPTWPGPVWRAAALLEDLRAEHAQISRRPLDVAWLRSASLALDVPDLRAYAKPVVGLWQAATAAALCPGRIDAGVLTATDTGVSEARDALFDAIGEELYLGLEAIWRAALTVADTDATAMYRLARQWCQLLTGPAAVINAADPGRQGDLADAVWDAAAALETAAMPPLLLPGGALGAREDDLPPCSDLFAYTAPPKRTRPATGSERSGAVRLAKALTDAARSPRTATTVSTAAPPGRLQMRGALAGAAQRAAGVPVTAKPWKQVKRKRSPDPAAKVGIALDASGSMDVFFRPATTAAWMLAHAAKRTGGTAAAATFGERVRALILPGKVPARIPEPIVEWSTLHLDVVVDALDRALGLGVPDQHARLLFLITDGAIWDPERHVAAQCQRLQKAGCAVIQIMPPRSIALAHCQAVEVADPLDSLRAITDATTAEMRAAARRER
jgi:hypothetical protein